MSNGIAVYAPDGSVVFDTTSNVWSLVGAAYIAEMQARTIALDPVVANSNLKVRIIRWAGQPPAGFGVVDTPTYYATDEAVDMLVSLFCNYTNASIIGSTDGGIYGVDFSLLTRNGIENQQLVAYLFYEISTSLTFAVRSIYYLKLYAQSGHLPYFSTALDLREAAYGALPISYGAKFRTLTVSLIPDDVFNGRTGAVNFPYTYPNGTIHKDDISNVIKHICDSRISSYEINAELLRTKTTVQYSPNLNRTDYKNPPTYTRSGNTIQFNGDNTVPVYAEVYAV